MKISRDQLGTWIFNHLHFVVSRNDLLKIRDAINARILKEIEIEQRSKPNIRFITDWSDPNSWDLGTNDEASKPRKLGS